MTGKKKNKIKTIFFTFITITIIVLVVAILTVMADRIRSRYPSILITDNAKLYFNNKKIDNGILSGKLIRNYKYGSELVIKSKITNSTITNPVLFFNNNINAGVRVYVENKMVFEHGMKAPKNSVVCNDNMKIPLMEDCNNKTLKIVLRCTNTGVFAKIPNIYYINSKDADTRNVLGNIAFELVGICLICVGIVAIALFVFNYGIEVIIKPVMYVSIASICSGLWILACYQLLNIFVDSIMVDFYAEYIAMYIMLLFFNYYVSEITCIQKDKIFLKVMRYVWVIDTIIAFSTQICNIWYMNDSIIGLQLTCLPIIICLIRYYVKKVRGKNKGYAVLYGCALISGGTSIVYCISHILKTSISLLNILPILFFFFAMSGIINVIMEMQKEYSNRAEKEALLELVYIDKLTGLNNRRALDKYEKQIIKNIDNTKYIIYSIDLNRLKYINDTYGHAAGDNLIITFSEQLKGVVGEDDFCGRMGGDEFIVIVNEEKYEGKLEKKLKEKVDNYNEISGMEYELKYSIGKAKYKVGGKETIDDCIRMADYNMYEMKSMYMKKNITNITKNVPVV